MNEETLKNILEASLFAAGGALSVAQLQDLFPENERPATDQIRQALTSIQEDFETRGIVLAQVASGYRFQTSPDVAEWVSRLWEERPPRYSRALLETLALIAYRQPVTRGEIEDVRGVSVSSNIVKTLLERQWVRVVGHRDVPGRPAMYGTTKEFLDYFGLKSLDELPPLSELRDIDTITRELDLALPEENRPAEASAEPSQDSEPTPELGFEEEPSAEDTSTVDNGDAATDDPVVEVAEAEEPDTETQSPGEPSNESSNESV